jgi:phytoene dehydrogenase-like protein
MVIGSGPNGLAAAIVLARAGRRVTVHEAAALMGGGARTAELTLPGFHHDICSAVHPMAVTSPCFEQFPLAAHGLEWIHPGAPAAHPLDDGTAVMLERSMDATAANLGGDGERWRRLFSPWVEAWPDLRHSVFQPLAIPRRPLLMARLGAYGLRSARSLAEGQFRGVRARALFAGIASHSVLPLEAPISSAIGIVITVVGHACGWPIPRGGSQSITAALAGTLRDLGGEIVTESRIDTLPESDGRTIWMCDVGPRQLLAIAGDRLPGDYRRSLSEYRYGPGAFKLDWALDAPIPWRAAECARAGTVHVGGTLEEIAQWEAHHTGAPFVLLAQPSLFDPTRAPAGKHTAWAYCHVPNGWAGDMTDAIEAQVERFAPGFRARILGRSVLTPQELERRNANLVGGDVNGGSADIRQFFLRPNYHFYKVPLNGVYLCSASTPPGGGVHGMCGYHAAQLALRA